MKKLLILFIGLSLAMTSCSSDDNGGGAINGNIVGTWMLTKLTTETNMPGISATGQGKNYDATLTFNDEPNEVFGTGSVGLEVTTYINGVSFGTAEEVINFDSQFGAGQWELSGNTLTLSGEGSAVTVTVLKLTPSSLIFRYDTDGTTIVTYEFSK